MRWLVLIGLVLAIAAPAAAQAPVPGCDAAPTPLARPTAPPTAGQGVFLMSGFRDCHGVNGPGSEQRLRLFTSLDGLTWTEISPRWFYEDRGGGVIRDPSIVYYRHRWWIAYTNDYRAGVLTPQWSIASSSDLVRWTHVAHISVASVPGAFNVWAPEFFIDDAGAPHVFVSISTGRSDRNFQTYETHAVDTAALTAWSDPALVTGDGFSLDVIDAFPLRIGPTYYLFWKNERTWSLSVSSSATLTGGYKVLNAQITARRTNCEGPSVVGLGGGLWRLYCDQRIDQGIRFTDSADGFMTWTPLAPVVSDSPAWNHGTALRLTDPEAIHAVLALRAATAAP